MNFGGKIGELLAVVLFLVIGAILVIHTNERDNRLRETSDCVVRMATQSHYSGNVHSQQAWDLFASLCE